MTRTEEAIFNNKLMALLTKRGESDMNDKEFFERLLYANSCIARCLLTFNDIYDDVKKDTVVEENTPVPPYYVASVSNGKTCASLGFYSTGKEAQTSIIEYENALNPSKTYYDWYEFIHDYYNDETKITDYDISSKFLDVNC